MVVDLSVRLNGKEFRCGGSGEGTSWTFWYVESDGETHTFQSFGDLMDWLRQI